MYSWLEETFKDMQNKYDGAGTFAHFSILYSPMLKNN